MAGCTGQDGGAPTDLATSDCSHTFSKNLLAWELWETGRATYDELDVKMQHLKPERIGTTGYAVVVARQTSNKLSHNREGRLLAISHRVVI